jgi:hypothetical protein
MSQPQINFQVRINDSADVQALGERVGRALGCSFTRSYADEFEGAEALETQLLGLWITLTRRPASAKHPLPNYRLVGTVMIDDLPEWGDELIVISPYIQGLLERHDGPGWYVPDLAELRSDAGLA